MTREEVLGIQKTINEALWCAYEVSRNGPALGGEQWPNAECCFIAGRDLTACAEAHFGGEPTVHSDLTRLGALLQDVWTRPGEAHRVRLAAWAPAHPQVAARYAAVRAQAAEDAEVNRPRVLSTAARKRTWHLVRDKEGLVHLEGDSQCASSSACGIADDSGLIVDYDASGPVTCLGCRSKADQIRALGAPSTRDCPPLREGE